MAEESLIGRPLGEVPTPCLLVDLDRVKGNAERMRRRCEEMGLKLRPHMKTHKTLEAGIMMTNGTKRCIVVSTLREAEFYADEGFDDILYGCMLTASKIERCQKLANRLTEFHVMVDSIYGLNILESSPPNGGKKWSAVLKIDCGNRRAGVGWDSDQAVTLAKAIDNSPHVQLWGIYSHCGNSYSAQSTDGIQAVGSQTIERLISLKTRLKSEGIDIKEVGTGSTPSCSQPIKVLGGLTEIHPGNYIFYDWMQYNLGSCSLDDIACRVVTRVTGHYPDRGQILVDAGFTALSHDGLNLNLPMATGCTFIQDNPNLKITGLTQEVGYVKAVEGDLDFTKYPIGSLLFIYPYHSCATAMLHPVYYVHTGDQITAVWRPVRGW